MPIEQAIHRDAWAKVLEPTIARRSIRLGAHMQAPFMHVFFLAGGTARLETGDNSVSLAPAAVAILPPGVENVAILEAGSQGYLIGVSSDILAEAIGDYAESDALRLFARRSSHKDQMPDLAVAKFRFLAASLAEELSPDGAGSPVVVSAYLRLMLVESWRLIGEPRQAPEGVASAMAILQGFRQLVEVRFRAHEPVSAYAKELGVSPDRLHAISRRTLGKTPIQLIHDRVTREARLRLERSPRSVQEISESLGFRDPTYFSHFFKRQTGLSPLAYRQQLKSADRDQDVLAARSYADWP